LHFTQLWPCEMSNKRKRSSKEENTSNGDTEGDGWGSVDLGDVKFEHLNMEDVEDDEDSYVDNSHTNDDDDESDEDGYDAQNEAGEDDDDDVYVSDDDEDLSEFMSAEELQEEDEDDDDIGGIKVLHSFDNETEEEKRERKQKQFEAEPSIFDDVDNSDDSSEDEVKILNFKF
jgi:hypothetical protein